MKDNFSQQAAFYKKFRPVYPQSIYAFIYSKVSSFSLAWDCATGNGQVAEQLADKFNKVIATDISQMQLDKAKENSKISYRPANAVHSGLEENSVNLITVAQGLHWFAEKAFFEEAKRVLKRDGILASWCYGLVQGDDRFNKELGIFYKETIGMYWDEERKHIDQAYDTIPFPAGTETQKFEMHVSWTFEHFIGYLNSWSAVQHYINDKGVNPVIEVALRFKDIWQEECMSLSFPITLKWKKYG